MITPVTEVEFLSNRISADRGYVIKQNLLDSRKDNSTSSTVFFKEWIGVCFGG
jgi:hypothetical protein